MSRPRSYNELVVFSVESTDGKGIYHSSELRTGSGGKERTSKSPSSRIISTGLESFIVEGLSE